MISDNYEFVKTIGEGSFAKVVLAKRRDGAKVAVKIIKKKSKSTKEVHIKREVTNLRSIDHTHIVKCFDLIQDEKKYYIIMEYIKGSELLDVILSKNRGLSEGKSKKYFAQLISAVSYCHSQFISHRDLKPENILIDKNDNIKLIDFGLSTRLHTDGSGHNTWCGSPMYSPPEIFSQDTYKSPQIDIWSLGIILYAMLTSTLPFSGRDDMELMTRIQNCKYKIPIYMPLLVVDLLTQILKKNPADRISLAQIREHKWLAEYAPIDLQIPKLPKVLSINLLIIEKMEKLGFDGDETMKSLRHERNNEYTTVYHDLKERIYRSDPQDPQDPAILEIPYISTDDQISVIDDTSTLGSSPTLSRVAKISKSDSGKKFLQKIFHT